MVELPSVFDPTLHCLATAALPLDLRNWYYGFADNFCLFFNMEISNMLDKEDLYSIFAGKALLFMGAGFSIGALRDKNAGEDKFPTGECLAIELLEDLGQENTGHKNLATCAAYYESQKTRQGLLRALGKMLKVKKVQDFHCNILSQPWLRIYTTNYDDLALQAWRGNTKLRRVGLRDPLPEYNANKTDCLYINGYIDYEVLDKSEIVITKQDYSSASNSVREEIIANFLEDATMAEKVFFIGYSLYDIEVAKILQNNLAMRNKVYFIVGDKIDKIDESEIAAFGSVLKINAQKFSEKMQDAAISFQNLTPSEPALFSLEKYEICPANKDYKDDVYELLARSRVNRAKLKRQIFKGPIYAVLRQRLDEVGQRILAGKSLTAIYARFCNGKTIFLEELAASFSDKMPVYFARADAKSLRRDLLFLSKNLGEQKALILVDGYGRAFPLLENLVPRLPNLLFVLAERTPIHRQLWSKLIKNAPEAAAFSLESLEEEEKKCFVNLLRNFGFSGESEHVLLRKLDSLYGNALGRAIFAIIKDSEVARLHVEKFKKDIDSAKRYEDELYVVVMLSILEGVPVLRSRINLILNRNTAYTADFSHSRFFEDILEDMDNYLSCQGGLALEITKHVFQPEKAREILLKLVKFFRKKQSNNYLYKLGEQCLRFFYLEKLFPEDGFKNNVNAFYEEVKRIGDLGGHPLFWLQFAIAKFHQREYLTSMTYINTAMDSAITKKFDPFQIENFKARLFLGADSSLGIDPWERFSQARDLLFKQIRNVVDEHIFRAAAELRPFVNAYLDKFDKSKLELILEFAEVIIEKYRQTPYDTKRDARHDLERIKEAKDKLKEKLVQMG